MPKTKKQDSYNDQTVMFGSKVSNIFSSLHSSLHKATQVNISSLPIIQDDENGSCENKIYSKVSKVYMLYLDMAQLYAENELFIVDKTLGRRKRERIVNEFLVLEECSRMGAPLPDETKEKNGKEVTKKKVQNEIGSHGGVLTFVSNDGIDAEMRYKIPTSYHDIPSLDQMKTVDHKILSLRKEMREVYEKKYSLEQQLHCLGRKESSATKGNESLSKLGTRKEGTSILESVRNIEHEKGQLKKMKLQATELKKKMNSLEEEHSKGNETQEFGDTIRAASIEASNKTTRPTKKKTLEEDYQNRKKESNVTGGVVTFFQT